MLILDFLCRTSHDPDETKSTIQLNMTRLKSTHEPWFAGIGKVYEEIDAERRPANSLGKEEGSHPNGLRTYANLEAFNISC